MYFHILQGILVMPIILSEMYVLTYIISYEEFNRKMGYINFCQFKIFAIEAFEI